jgi:transposase
LSEACRTLGYSRDTFYRLKKQYEEGGLDGLKEIRARRLDNGLVFIVARMCKVCVVAANRPSLRMRGK